MILQSHLAAVAIAALAAATDFRAGKIPNWITLPPLVVAPVVYLIFGGVTASVLSLAGIILCGLVPYLLYRRDAIGGGDVKLFAALGAVVGPFTGIEAQLMAFLIAGIYAVVKLGVTGKLGRLLKNSGRLMINPILPKDKRKEIDPDALTSMRLGGSVLAGISLSVALQHPGWWS